MEISQQTIEKYLAGKASAEEKQLVNDWYYSFNDDDAQLPAGLQTLRNEIKNRVYARLQQNIRRQRPAAKVINIKRWAFAAAVLAAVVISGYLYFAPADKNIAAATKRPPTKAAIMPGGNKAVLTLADGSEIVLDSAQNGTISLQGETKVIKLNNGQLAYKADAPASEGAVAFNTVTTPRGGQYQIVLPDGTRVWLNSASSLRFPTVFSDTRKVMLTGEGYFEVQPATLRRGSQASFVVTVDSSSAGRSMQVTVLGTKFNIMAYNDEEAIKTTLVEGAVAASRKSEKVVVRPGQQAGIKNNEAKFAIANADVREALAWKNGEFRFNKMNISSIMRQLARWYDVDVQYAGNLSGIELSGVIPRKEDISELLDVLETTGKVHFKVERKKVTAMPAQN